MARHLSFAKYSPSGAAAIYAARESIPGYRTPGS
jgi:hypothetical protein